MIRAVLQYTDCMQDGKNVFRVLVENRIPIMKTISPIFSICPRIIVLCKDYAQLECILYQLNTKCTYEVRLVKYKILQEG